MHNLVQRHMNVASTLVLVVSTLLVSVPVHAIVNIESIRPLSDEAGLVGKLDLKASGNKGNTDKTVFEVQNSTVWNRPTAQNFLILRYSYGESRGIKDKNQAFGHVRHVEEIVDTDWAWETFAQLQSDEFRRLNLRALLGAGGRVQVAQWEEGGIHSGIGAFYSREDLEASVDAPGEIEETARANLYMSLKYAVSDRFNYGSSFYYQPRFDEVEDYHVLWDNELSVVLTGQLALAVELRIMHDNRPPENVEKTDIAYLTGLSWTY